MMKERKAADEAAFNSDRADAYSLNENLQFKLGFLAGVRWSRKNPAGELTYMREEFERAVEAATPYLQCGGPFSHLLGLGESMLIKGIPALCREIQRLEALLAATKRTEEGA